MKKFLIGALILAASATPAMAQRQGDGRGPGREQGYNNRGSHFQARIAELRRDIEQASERRAIDRYEYAALIKSTAAARSRLDEYARRGLNPWERSQIEERLAKIEHNLEVSISERGSRYAPVRRSNRYRR